MMDYRLLSLHAQADSQRVMTFSNEEDVVFFRHHMYEQRGGKEVVLHEVGPRFEMQLYQLRLGTLDQVRIDMRGVVGSQHFTDVIYAVSRGIMVCAAFELHT